MTKCVCFNCRHHSNSGIGYFCSNGRWIPEVPNADATEGPRSKQGSNFGRCGRIIDTTLVGAECFNKNPKFYYENDFSNRMNYGDEQAAYSSQYYARNGEGNLLMAPNSGQDHLQEWATSDMNNPVLFHRNEFETGIKHRSNFRPLVLINETLNGAKFFNKHPQFCNENGFSNQVNYEDRQSTCLCHDYARKEESSLLTVMNSGLGHVQYWTPDRQNNSALFHRNELNIDDYNMEMRTDFPTTERPQNIHRPTNMKFQMGVDKINRKTSIPYYNPNKVKLIRPNSESMPRQWSNKLIECERVLNDMYIGKRSPDKSKTGISSREKTVSDVGYPVDYPRAYPGSFSQVNKKKSLVRLKKIQSIGSGKRHSMVDIDQKRFICHICNKGFTRDFILEVHMVGHDVNKTLK